MDGRTLGSLVEHHTPRHQSTPSRSEFPYAWAYLQAFSADDETSPESEIPDAGWNGLLVFGRGTWFFYFYISLLIVAPMIPVYDVNKVLNLWDI